MDLNIIVMQNYLIYLITNTVNGKRYVGFTKYSIEKRWREHKSSAKCGSVYLLHAAIRKYGSIAFKIETLMQTEDLEYGLNVLEKRFIQEYKTFFKIGNGYNMTLGGDVCPILSEASLFKMKAAGRLRIGKLNPMFGRNHTQETKEKQSEKKKGWAGKDHPRFGKLHRLASIEKMRTNRTGKTAGASNPNAKEYLIASNDQIQKIHCLSAWCKENDINYGSALSSMRLERPMRNGLKIERIK